MKLLPLLKLAILSLLHHKSRSVLTALGIIIGVATVIAIMALLQGLQNSIDKEFSALGTNTIYVQKMELEFGKGPPRDFDEIAKRPDLTMKDAAAIAALDTVRVAVPSINNDLGTLKRGIYEADQCTLVGIGAGGELSGNWTVTAGRFITADDQQRRAMVCVIGSYISQNLFSPGENPLGQYLNLAGHRYRVVGILKEKGASFGRPQDNQVFIPVDTYLKYNADPTGRAAIWHGMKIEVLPKEGITVDAAKKDIEELMRLRHGLRYYEDNDFGLNTQASMLSSLNNITSILWIVMISVASISLLVGGIGIMNIMLVSVAERTREIGIRKAVGARDRDILVQFLLEAVTLSILGGAVGIVLGLGVAGLVSALSHSLKAAVVWWTIAVGCGFSAAVGIGFGVWPARKASRLNPIEAISYE